YRAHAADDLHRLVLHEERVVGPGPHHDDLLHVVGDVHGSLDVAEWTGGRPVAGGARGAVVDEQGGFRAEAGAGGGAGGGFHGVAAGAALGVGGAHDAGVIGANGGGIAAIVGHEAFEAFAGVGIGGDGAVRMHVAAREADVVTGAGHAFVRDW